jgi:hypothetical protein
VRHGLRSELPVIPGESADEWERHRAGVVRSLAPAGGLETVLAERVALSLWRLRRVVVYETAVTAVWVDEADEAVHQAAAQAFVMPGQEEPDAVRLQKVRQALETKRRTVEAWEASLTLLRKLADLPDDAPLDPDDVYRALQDVADELPDAEVRYFDLDDEKFLGEVGLPADERKRPWYWDGWTAGLVRRAVVVMAQQSQTSPQKILSRALRDREQEQADERAECQRLAREAARLQGKVEQQVERQRVRRLLPDGPTLDKVMRYEAHLSRQMLQALHTLERLQAARAGEPVPPPAAVDVTVSTPSFPVLDDSTVVADRVRSAVPADRGGLPDNFPRGDEGALAPRLGDGRPPTPPPSDLGSAEPFC